MTPFRRVVEGRSLLLRGPVRPVLAVALFALVGSGVPQPSVAGLDHGAPVPPADRRVAALAAPDLLDPAPPVQRFRDAEAKVQIEPPDGWQRSPETSLDRSGDDDLFEVARFQLRLSDPALYAQPLPVTSGLLADAGAVISVALAREGSDLLGAKAEDTETSYEGVVTFTRIVTTRWTGRTAVVRAFVSVAERDALAPSLLKAIASARVDDDGPLGPAYVAPPPPPPPPAPAPAAEPAPAAAVPDPSAAARAVIIQRAAEMLGTPYVWGGNVAGRAMDCSAYVSRAWGVSRYTTDSIWNVAVAISKDALLPGDALNLETYRDPTRAGHIRLFDAWANEARTLLWVYEETPPRAIHRVIAYDPSYRPIRLSWLGGGGVAPLVPAPAAQPIQRYAPGPAAPAATRRPAATPRPTASPRPATARPSATPRPSTAPRASASPRPSASAAVLPSASPRVVTTTVRPSATPRATPTATVRAATTTTSPTRSASAPRPSAQPKGR